MQLGQPKRLVSQGQREGLNRIRPEEGDNYFRILYGPMKISQIYYPTLVEDKDSGEIKQGIKVLNKPLIGTTPLDPIISLEKRVRKKMGEQKPNSSLYPSSKFLYLIINKESDDYPTVEVAEFTYQVYKRFVELEQAVSKKKPDKLRHGLIFMWDAIVTKTVDHGKAKRYGTKYYVEVDPENAYSGKIPSKFLGMEPDELAENVDFSDYFTEEEYEAIQACTIDLEELGKPDTYEEMEAKLAEHPLYLNATNSDGSFRFPRVEEFKAEILEMGIQITDGDDLKALPAAEEDKEDEEETPKPKPKPKTKPKPPVEEEEEEDEEWEEAEMVEEDEEDEEDEAPRPKKKSGKKKPKSPVEKEPEEEEEDDEDFPEW